MSKPASPTLIGTFVVGAVALAVTGVAVFGSGQLFRDTTAYILYFDSDVSGLKLGAPVKFKGVEIGTVTDVLLNVSSEGIVERTADNGFVIPVIIELDEDRIRARGGRASLNDPNRMQTAIDAGLRAQLAMESFVTGLLYVKLDVFPGTPVRLAKDRHVRYVEIPTLPTPLEEVQMKAAKFFAQLEHADIAGLINSLARTADGLDQLVNSPKLRGTIESLDVTMTALNRTITSVGHLSDDLRGSVPPLRISLQKTADDASAALQQARMSFDTAGDTLSADSPLAYELRTALEEVAGAARAVRVLAESLDRNPSVLVRGKPAPEKQP